MSAIADDFPFARKRRFSFPAVIGALIMAMGFLVNRGDSGEPPPATCGDSIWTDGAGNYWPDASCTGWAPTGVTLTAYTGSTTLSTGTTIDSKLINNCLTINGDNISITRSEVNCSTGFEWAIHDDGGHTNILVEDTLITCAGNVNNSHGYAGENFTLRRVNITNCENLVWINDVGNVLIEWSYLHEPIPYDSATDPHTDGIQNNGDNVTVQNSTILGGADLGEGWGSSGASTNFSNQNVVFDANLLAGGGYALRLDDQNVGGMQAEVTNNRFSTIYGPNVSGFGPMILGSGAGNSFTYSGNVCHESGQTLVMNGNCN